MVQRVVGVALIAPSLIFGSPSSGRAAGKIPAAQPRVVSFSATTGKYTIRFRSSSGAIIIRPKGKKAGLAIRELGSDKKTDLLYSVTSVHRSDSTYTLSGKASWASFRVVLALDKPVPGLLHLTVSVNPRRDMPQARTVHPDVQLVGAPSSSLKAYDAAPPVAGTSLFLANQPMDSSILYLANFTALGQFFDRTQSGAAQAIFSYPRAGGKGALVGVTSPFFGYELPATNLPHGHSTRVIDSFVYLVPGVPVNESAMSDTYLKMLGAMYSALPRPALPAADWHSLAARAGSDLVAPANLVAFDNRHFLVSYVSDTRKSPELLTQASVLAGVKAYEARYHETLALDSMLEQNLPAFYDAAFHTVKNGIGHDPAATEESWYYVTNLISLLQLAQLGSTTARQLLLDSVDGAIKLAHTNGYEFPQTFHFTDWNGKDTGLQPDVAGGYAWLMLGLFDLTKDSRYLDEAKASIAHVAGKGFGLAYETHMLGYTAAAAQRLYTMTKDPAYRGDALLALANLFHVTRLWDCTYGNCRKGAGYHTYFGINPLPWSDYIAPLEQYEAWLGLRDYMTYVAGEPGYIKDLVGAFLTETPLVLQYTIPTQLPAGVATASPGEYGFVTHNNLGWHIPLEDLRTGEQNSGLIGQEIYGAGAPFMLAAYAP